LLLSVAINSEINATKALGLGDDAPASRKLLADAGNSGLGAPSGATLDELLALTEQALEMGRADNPSV
jgi:hypothetical protein